jgi:Uma2 family endonuclease
MTTTSLPQLMTAEEFSDLPDDGTLYELSRGVLVCMSPSSYAPGRIAGRIMTPLFSFVAAHKLGECGSADTGFRLASDPDTVRAPDAWFIRASRIPEAGTPLVSALDAQSRVTAVFRPRQPVRFLDEDGVLDGEDVLPGFSLPLRAVFG